MSNIKAPFTAGEKAAYSAIRNLKGAIHAGKDPETLIALFDIVLDMAKIAAQDTPAYFRYYDLTQRYSVSRKTVESYRIPHYQFGGSIRFSRNDVLAWEATRRQCSD